MSKQSFTRAGCIYFCADSRFDIVIHLDITDAIFPHQTVNDFICMCNDFRLTEIKLVSASVIDSLSMSLEKCFFRHFLNHRTLDSHNFQLQPESRDHSFVTDIVDHFFDSIWKTFLRRFPFPYCIPPESVCIPACINTEIFTACFCRSIDEWDFFLCGRIRPEAVHVIIENDAQFFIILILSANRSSVFRQFLRHLSQFSGNCSHACRNCGKSISWFQVFEPVRLLFCRSAELHIQMIGKIADFPMPGTIMLDLPEQSASCFCVCHISHRNITLCRPVSGVGDLKSFGRTDRSLKLGKFHSCIRKRIFFYLKLFLPCIMYHSDPDFFVRCQNTFFFHAVQIEGRNIFQSLCFCSCILYFAPASYHGNSVKKLKVIYRL